VVQRKALPWDNVGYRDPLEVPIVGRGISPSIYLIGKTKESIGIYSNNE
jgi:hypothetical protein